MLRLDALIAGLPLRLERGSGDVTLRDLVEDSRRVTPGAGFIARPGDAADGRAFIGDAIARGAAAVITDLDPPADMPPQLAWVRAEQADVALAATLAERLFGHPSKTLTLIGVTGTNGKTTTATLIQHLLEAADLRCGLIGTLGATLPASDVHDNANGARSPAETLDTGLTTPGPIEVSRLLAQMRDHGCRAAVMEVSSHALAQGRAATLGFNVAVFTNLTGDHLDYHGTMDRYADAKARLFALLGPAGWCVVNADDPYAGRMIEPFAGPTEHVLRCTVRDTMRGPENGNGTGNETGVQDRDMPPPACSAAIMSLTADGSRARFDGPWGSLQATLPLVGRHNVANALQALAAASAVVDLRNHLPEALERCPPVPGRLERVPSDSGVSDAAEPSDGSSLPSVLVDYAHTHDALENVLLALRPLTMGRLRVVFGCGGDRDREKRPKMAQVAARFADELWVTSDNPRTEDPKRIIDDILAGLAAGDVQGAPVHVEPDRAQAIAAAIRAAAPEDTVLIAGKGHEDYQVLADRTIHFDDREQAAAALRQWHKHKERSAPCPPTG